MGVTGLWQIVQPCARPTKIETLNRKRLAVDASIWIYQFLKAVRDKEGNALRNSHVVGFFRRICKLLFFGIKPVFVFDGGAPALKRQTISARKARREGRREDAVRTAGKLLAVQMQRRAEEEEALKKASREPGPPQEEMVADENLVYVDEMGMSQQERQQTRKFRKKDAYHLPDMNVSMSEMGGPNDPRIMSLEELQSYARQFDTGEDINVYDFSKIDYDSPFFMSLPASDRYNILNAARLRSRLRMGHSKEQLDSMFPDRMAFSKFQIERVRERNELTQRLMHLNGFEGTEFGIGGPGRIAGEKGREYVLVKNDGVEGGWALGVISEEGKEDRPIDVDGPEPVLKVEKDEEWEDDEEAFEDVPIEGLNRLPKPKTENERISNQLLQQRKAVYQSRKQKMSRKPRQGVRKQDPNSLFVQSSDDEEPEWENVKTDDHKRVDNTEQDSEDENLRRAIEMSLQKEAVDEAAHEDTSGTNAVGPDAEDDDMLEVFRQSAAPEHKAIPKGSGRAIANLVNRRAYDAAPESREITSFGVPTQRPDSSEEEDSMDLQAALAESRKTRRKVTPRRRSPPKPVPPKPKPDMSAAQVAKTAGFSGPLPFEKLDLGSSLLGKKKMQERAEEVSGGFENPEMAEKQKRKAEPLPPWFSGDLDEGLKAQKAIELEDRERAKEFGKRFLFQKKEEGGLRTAESNEVIDLEVEDDTKGFTSGEIVDLEADESVEDADEMQTVPLDEQLRMGDLADKLRVEPPSPPSARSLSPRVPTDQTATADRSVDRTSLPRGKSEREEDGVVERNAEATEKDDEALDWSESEAEDTKRSDEEASQASAHVASAAEPQRSKSPSVEFEDVGIPDAPRVLTPGDEVVEEAFHDTAELAGIAPASGLAVQQSVPEYDEFDDFSDPEEQEMLRALAAEAEEHARFASQLNNKTQAQNIQDYEKELRQLRNQQKKDRRDADEVTHVMITECQQLLRLFGLPYITAPMEAEAQCAELVNLGLVDGIVTDDSDCFLFGGTRIYKNMFNQAKFVECYLTSDLEKEFDLTRDKLIAVAHLLGSDYTEGLPGVGPVTALEIISEFGSLKDFTEWWTAVQTQSIPKSDDASNAFRKKFRRNAAKLFLPATFPDQRVEMAYLQPEVDHDAQGFEWGVPDLAALRAFLMATIGWSEERTDEVLVPVIRDMNRRRDEGTQANLTSFFEGSVGVGAVREAFAPRKRVEGSKRMGSALNRLAERAKEKKAGSGVEEGATITSRPTDAGNETAETSMTKRAKKRKLATRETTDGSEDDASEFDEQQKKTKKRAKPKRSRKKMLSEDE